MHSDTRTVKQRVFDCIAEYTAHQVTERLRLTEDLQLENSDRAALACDLEGQFRIMFDEDDDTLVAYTGASYTQWITVADVLSSVMTELGKKTK